MCEIGVLDSGVGGLSVLRSIHETLPDIATIYFADQAHVPYGPRPAAEIDSYVVAIARHLIERGAAVIVVACHAASAASLYHLRREFPSIPFVGIEPAVKPAVLNTKTGTIGVLTTAATAQGLLYQRVLARYAGETTVITRIAPELVTLVESGQLISPESVDVLHHYIAPLMAEGADHVVLACTHFPFLTDQIRDLVGPDVSIVDPAPAVARQVVRMLPCSNNASRAVEHTFLTSGDPIAFARQTATLLDLDIEAQRVSDIFTYG